MEEHSLEYDFEGQFNVALLRRTNHVFENPDGPAPYVWKRNRTMRKDVACIHHLFFMIE